MSLAMSLGTSSGVSTPPPDPRFFLIVAPGLEAVAERELRGWLPPDHRTVPVTTSRGGLELGLPLEVGLALPRRLKVVSRTLLRVADFACRDFPKLFKKIRGLPWADWIQPGDSVRFEVSSRASRLKIKKRIEKTAADGFRAGFATPVRPGSFEHAVYVRFNDDICEISLDLSGEHQHRRGERTLVGEAPLRETLAAGLLRVLSAVKPCPSGIELFDPMCGAGTFALEALGWAVPVRARPYAFEHLRAVHDRRWVEAALTPPGDTPSILFALARDIDPEACRAANGNLRAAGFSNQSSVVQSDVFDEASGDVALPAPAVGVERWLIVNPPYGERLRAASGAARGSEKLSDFYGRLAARAEALARPARAGFLLPANADPKRIRWPKAWTRAAEPLPLSNGGLSVAFHVFTRL